MGFASGSYAAQAIWDRLKKDGLLPKSKAAQQKVAEIIVDEFENLDADDWDYEKGSVYQVARPEEVEDAERDDEDDFLDDDEDDVEYEEEDEDEEE